MQNNTTATDVAKINPPERAKLTPFYVNVPRTNIIAESEKSILINSNSHTFWLAKKYAKNSEMYKFCDVVQITLFKEWEYEVTDDLAIIEKYNGQGLSAFLSDEFEFYNFSNLNRTSV